MFGAGHGDAEESRVCGGTQTILNLIATRLGSPVLLNTPVREIIYDDAGVVVRAEGLSVRAQAVIVTVATAVVNAIQFQPALPVNRIQLQQRFLSGSAWKISLIIR